MLYSFFGGDLDGQKLAIPQHLNDVIHIPKYWSETRPGFGKWLHGLAERYIRINVQRLNKRGELIEILSVFKWEFLSDDLLIQMVNNALCNNDLAGERIAVEDRPLQS